MSSLIDDRKALAKLMPGGGSYKDVCIFSNLGSSNCKTGVEYTCVCRLEGQCADGSLLLFLNRTSTSPAQRKSFIGALQEATATIDRSCGGFPVFPAPNNFTHGKACTKIADCSDAVLKKCTPGVDCKWVPPSPNSHRTRQPP